MPIFVQPQVSTPQPVIAGKTLGRSARLVTSRYPELSGIIDDSFEPVHEIDLMYGDNIALVTVEMGSNFVSQFLEGDTIQFSATCIPTPITNTTSAIGASLAQRLERLKAIERLFSGCPGVKFYYRVNFGSPDVLVVHFSALTQPTVNCFCIACEKATNGVLTGDTINNTQTIVASRLRNGVLAALGENLTVTVSELSYSIFDWEGTSKRCCNLVEEELFEFTIPPSPTYPANFSTGTQFEVFNCGNREVFAYLVPKYPNEFPDNTDLSVSIDAVNPGSHPNSVIVDATYNLTTVGYIKPGEYPLELWVRLTNESYGDTFSESFKVAEIIMAQAEPGFDNCYCPDCLDTTEIIVEYQPTPLSSPSPYNSINIKDEVLFYDELFLEFPNYLEAWYGEPYLPANYVFQSVETIPLPGRGNVDFRVYELTTNSCCTGMTFENFGMTFHDSFLDIEQDAKRLSGEFFADGQLLQDYLDSLNPDLTPIANSDAKIFIHKVSETDIPIGPDSCYEYVWHIFCAEHLPESLFISDKNVTVTKLHDTLSTVHFFVEDCRKRQCTIYKTAFYPNLIEV